MGANRSELIKRIQSLTDDEVERVKPYLEADLDSVADLAELQAEVRRARENARSEPLVDNEEVMDLVRNKRTRGS